jgi:hypothetical protein
MFFLSCKKDTSISPPNTSSTSPGSVNGSVNPAYAVISITLSSTTGGQSYSTTPNSNGDFTFTSIPVGSYILNVATISLYHTPTGVNVTITSGNNTQVNAITLTYNNSAQTGIINYTLDGVSYTDYPNYVGLGYSNNNFRLTGATNSNPSYYYLDISLLNVTNPGVYNTTYNSSYISLFHYASPGNADGYWSTNNGGSGAVNITMINTSNRTMSGTFSGTLVPQGISIGTKQISGSFSNVVY